MEEDENVTEKCSNFFNFETCDKRGPLADNTLKVIVLRLTHSVQNCSNMEEFKFSARIILISGKVLQAPENVSIIKLVKDPSK